MNQKTKVAMIGVGNWGKNLLREFNEQAQVVYACHNGSPTSKTEVGKYPHIKSTTNFYEVLNDKSVVAVVIATPTPTHHKIAMQALKAGKHVFLEKPGGTSYRELEEIATEADRRKLKVALGYEFVWHPALREIFQRVDSNDILWVHFSWFKWGTFKDNIIPHLVSHEISIALALGLYDFKVMGKSIHDALGEWDIIHLELNDISNTELVIDINRAMPDTKLKVVQLFTEKGGYIWHNNDLSEFTKGDEVLKPVELPKTTSVAAEIRDFLASIENPYKRPLVDGRFGLDVWRMIEKIQNF
jgi:predicted dehydrogenase